MVNFKRVIAVFTVITIILVSMPYTVFATEDDGTVGTTKPASSQNNAGDPAAPYISSLGICMLDANTGAIIYARNEHMQLSMASTTKVMTCLIALEQGDVGREIVITEDMLGADGTKLGLELGDKITLYDLIVSALILSGNDAADAIAVAVAGSREEFASMMNERAAEIGMFNTNFVTPSGLDDDVHFSTPYDMALLGIEAAKNPDLLEITSAISADIYVGNPKKKRTLTTHNRLLTSVKVEGCKGLKTGNTVKSGSCLLSYVERDGVRLVCASMKGTDYFNDHKRLYNYSFPLYEKMEIDPSINNLELLLVGGEKQTVALECEGASSFAVQKKQKDEVYKQIKLNKFEYAPVTAGQVVGYVQYMYKDMLLAQFPIKVTEDVKATTDAWLSAYLSAAKYKASKNAA
ncbi:MAG: D-alanyl-D-alanine carboxypeptidase [Oscillospiraceae bacterium]|jgi:D-alanyl-D-alanine carboxypeptidase/D-alanyl-D-alanine carboxypeptidase (penicillin-binding protein 5/6)|nr:D-alanyl-D-alanine carboxypeptidase [Oscillospiraceae bacterium]